MLKFFPLILIFVGLLAVAVPLGSATSVYAPQVADYSEQLWKRLTLPVKTAYLAAQNPDNVLHMPVDGMRVDEVSDTWGDPRPGGRIHEGQDIFAPRGTPIYSATEGYVVSINERGIGGKYVFVFGAGGRRYYYAHLDAFAEDIHVGDWVDRDTVIGYVGNTGNAAATPPHLHFGVYERGVGAIDPLPLMRDRH